MGHLFYFIGLIYVIRTLWFLTNPERRRKSLIKFSRKIRQISNKRIQEYLRDKGEYGWVMFGVLFKMFSMFFYMGWVFIGLLSGQWYIFLTLIISGILLSKISGLFKNKNWKSFMIGFGSLINIILIGYAVLNHFHHLNWIVI